MSHPWETEVTLPSRKPLVAAAEAMLKDKLKETRADAYLAEQELQVRLDNLLSLEYSPS